MRYLSSLSLALIVLMALACTTTPAPTPLPTPDVPLLDEKTVENLTSGFLLQNLDAWRYEECLLAADNINAINAQYIGKDIWVVEIEPPNMCTFTVHDKEARVIQRK